MFEHRGTGWVSYTRIRACDIFCHNAWNYRVTCCCILPRNPPPPPKKSISLMAASDTVVIMTRCTLISPSACDWGQHSLTACCGGNHFPSLPLIRYLTPPTPLLRWSVSVSQAANSPPQLDRGSMKTSRQYDYITSCVLPKKSGLLCTDGAGQREQELYVG